MTTGTIQQPPSSGPQNIKKFQPPNSYLETYHSDYSISNHELVSSLHAASFLGREGIVSALLKYAAKDADQRKFHAFLNARNDLGETPLMDATHAAYPKIVFSTWLWLLSLLLRMVASKCSAVDTSAMDKEQQRRVWRFLSKEDTDRKKAWEVIGKERRKILVVMVEEALKKMDLGFRGGMQGGEGWAGTLGLREKAEVTWPTMPS